MMGYKDTGSMKKTGKSGTAQNMTHSGKSNTMPTSPASFNNYGLSSGKITKRSAK